MSPRPKIKRRYYTDSKGETRFTFMVGRRSFLEFLHQEMLKKRLDK